MDRCDTRRCGAESTVPVIESATIGRDRAEISCDSDENREQIQQRSNPRIHRRYRTARTGQITRPSTRSRLRSRATSHKLSRKANKKHSNLTQEHEGNSASMQRRASRSQNGRRHSGIAYGGVPVTENDRSGDFIDVTLDSDEDAKYHTENKISDSSRSSSEREVEKWMGREIDNNRSPFHVPNQRPRSRRQKADQIVNIFGAILKEIENLSVKKDQPRKKTLCDVIESNQSLASADYDIPSAMINERAIEVLQALIDHKTKPKRLEGSEWSSSVELGQTFSSSEWYGQSQPLHYQAKVISDSNAHNMLTSSSAGSGPTCRICREGFGTLVRPCRCRGSMAYVHVECLQKWLTEKEIDYCEVCRYVFRVIHVPEYRLIPSIGFWYKFAATRAQKKRILIDVTLAVLCLPILMYVTIFSRPSGADYPFDYLHDEEMEGEVDWKELGWSLLVYLFRFFTFLLNLLYVGTVLVRVNHHLGTWLSWYVNKNVTVVLEDRVPGSVRTVDNLGRSYSE